jgi:hypothetical protein
LSEYVQKRVNKAYATWKAGAVRVMRRRDNSRFVEYKKEPLVPYIPQMKINLSSGGVKLAVGPVNRHDYSNFNEILSKRG